MLLFTIYGRKKRGKDLIPSGGDKIHKISEQLLSFGVIRIRSRCHCYDVNLTPKFCLALKKCGHTSQWFLLGVNLPEVESRTLGSRSRPRPRTQKKSEAKAKDSLSEDRTSRGQGQQFSRPRPRTKDTAASVLQKKKRNDFKKVFQAIFNL